MWLSESDDILQELGRHQVRDLVPILDANGSLVAGASTTLVAESRRCALEQSCAFFANSTIASLGAGALSALRWWRWDNHVHLHVHCPQCTHIKRADVAFVGTCW